MTHFSRPDSLIEICEHRHLDGSFVERPPQAFDPIDPQCLTCAMVNFLKRLGPESYELFVLYCKSVCTGNYITDFLFQNDVLKIATSVTLLLLPKAYPLESDDFATIDRHGPGPEGPNSFYSYVLRFNFKNFLLESFKYGIGNIGIISAELAFESFPGKLDSFFEYLDDKYSGTQLIDDVLERHYVILMLAVLGRYQHEHCYVCYDQRPTFASHAYTSFHPGRPYRATHLGYVYERNKDLLACDPAFARQAVKKFKNKDQFAYSYLDVMEVSYPY